MHKNLRDFLLLIRLIVARFVQDRCPQAAASLTLATLFSLVPLLTIALAMFSAFPIFESFSEQIKGYLLKNLMPDTAGVIISQYVQQFADSAARLTTVGIVFLAVTAMSMMLTIDRAFNIIWRVSRPRPLVKRLVTYWAVLTLAPLLIGASLSLTSWLVSISMGYAQHMPLFKLAVLKILPVFFTTLAFTILFRLVPNRHVPRMHAFIGALVAAIVFESMNRLFGYYISHFPAYKLIYGAFVSVPIFLMWIYLSWMVTLFGAVIAASLSHWRAPASQHLKPAAYLIDALRLLRLLAQCQELGKVGTFPEMSKQLRMGYDELAVILEKLAKANIVSKAESAGWLLMRDPGKIRSSELLRIFVIDAGSFPAELNNDPLQQWALAMAGRMEKNSDISLRELLLLKPA